MAKGFFKRALSSFVDFEDKETKQSDKSQTTESPSNSVSTEIPTESFNFDGKNIPSELVNSPISASQGAFNQEFYDHLQAEIANNDQDGADYFEFRKVYEAMKKSMPNEAAALSAAFSALQATSPELTVDRLIETADFYLGVIEKEDQDFMTQFEGEYQKEVVGRQDSIDSELAIQAELQQKLVESQERVSTLSNEKAQEEAKLNGVKANWGVTKQLVTVNIENDKKNILTFLQTTPQG